MPVGKKVFVELFGSAKKYHTAGQLFERGKPKRVSEAVSTAVLRKRDEAGSLLFRVATPTDELTAQAEAAALAEAQAAAEEAEEAADAGTILPVADDGSEDEFGDEPEDEDTLVQV